MEVDQQKEKAVAMVAHYNQMFGCDCSVMVVNRSWDQVTDDVPPIMLCRYAKADTGLPHDVLITAGMSQWPMAFPADYDAAKKWSCELVMCVDEGVDESADGATNDEQRAKDNHWMQWLSDLPFFDGFVLGTTHTISLGHPLYADSALEHFFFMETLVFDWRTAVQKIEAEQPIQLLQVVPITAAEYQYKREAGANALLDLLDQHDHPLCLERHRRCYLAES